jgi:hypothetical protein
MNLKKATAALAISALALFACDPSIASAQETSTANKNVGAKSEMKKSGSEAKKAGTSLGTNVKKGKVVRGGKEFGKHAGKSGKHFGKGTAKGAKKGAKKTADVVKKAAKP